MAMAVRAMFLVLLIAVAFVANASAGSFGDAALESFSAGELNSFDDGFVGDIIGDEETQMESEVARRGLAQRRRFLSYDLLKKNRVPCTRRGHSYYGCQRNVKVNPYRRGCTAITQCARNTY